MASLSIVPSDRSFHCSWQWIVPSFMAIDHNESIRYHGSIRYDGSVEQIMSTRVRCIPSLFVNSTYSSKQAQSTANAMLARHRMARCCLNYLNYSNFLKLVVLVSSTLSRSDNICPARWGTLRVAYSQATTVQTLRLYPHWYI
jgi:hypothetical protein